MPPADSTATDNDVPRGLALLCDKDGVVQNVLRDDLALLGDVVGQALPFLVDPSSRDKAARFLAEVVTLGAAFDWEIGLPQDETVRLLHLAGALTDDGDVVIVGAPTRTAISRYYDELMRMNNEQTNALRQALKPSLAVRPPAPERDSDRDSDVYEKLMRLNNELATVQRELTKKNLELERANALKNQFLGMAAHDLRNPIGAIRSFSMLLLDDEMPIPPEQHRDCLRRIKGSSEFMLALIDDLLDISAIDAGQLRLDRRDIDLGQLAHDNVELNRLLAQDKGIEIELSVAPDLPRVAADARKLEQVLNNLVGNAVKFSLPGTVVRIDVTPDDGGVRMRIVDEGPGIAAHEVAKLFTPFQRATPRGTAGERSTGLGLAIVKRIVDGHGGRLLCESEVGRGTTFSVWLPAGTSAPAP